MVVARGGQEWHGRNAIRAFMREINTRQGDRDTCHLSGNVVIAIEGDTAKLDADMLFHERASVEGPWRNSQLNRYTADLSRANSGNWLFSRWAIEPRLAVTSRSAEMAAAPPLSGVGEINKTLALYAHFLDDHDAENWSQFFAARCTFSLAAARSPAARRSRTRSRRCGRRIPSAGSSTSARPRWSRGLATATAETEISEYEPAGRADVAVARPRAILRPARVRVALAG